MGATYSSDMRGSNTRISNTRTSNSSKQGENTGIPGMTPIICQRCGRRLGQVYSTNGFVTCDKCGRKSYTRIDKGAVIILPANYLDYEGYYEDAEQYMHKVRERVNGEQVLIRYPLDEME